MDIAVAVNIYQLAASGVKLYKRRRLPVIYLKPLCHRFNIIVLAGYKSVAAGGTAFIPKSVYVIGASAGRAASSPAKPIPQNVLININVKRTSISTISARASA